MTTLKVRVNSRAGFSEAEIVKHQMACDYLQEVVNTVEFRAAVIGRVYTSTNKTGIEIYQHIMTGAEVISPDVDHEIDVDAILYYKNNSTVGYTYAKVIFTWVNRKFFGQYDYGEVAGNLFHEWLHKLGYSHRSSTDYNSPPYALGYLVRDMIRELIAGKQFTRIDGATQPDFDPPVVIKPREYVCRRSWKTLWLKKVCYYVE